MKTTFGNWLSALAICALTCPAQAIEPSTGASTVTDVALAETGDFFGAVVDGTGKPLANVPVQVVHNQRVVATAKTNSKGSYSVQGLRSGLHIVQTANKSQACRFWTAASAPPSARRSLVVADGQTVLRGQGGAGISLGTILPVAAFAAVSAVTVSSSTGNKTSTPTAVSPASP